MVRPAMIGALILVFVAGIEDFPVPAILGGPVGVDNLAAAIGEERDTIEDVLEPYLIQQGYLQRTPRGRMATASAYRHFGLAQPKGAVTPDLWDAESAGGPK